MATAVRINNRDACVAGGTVQPDCSLTYVGRTQFQGGWRLLCSKFANPYGGKRDAEGIADVDKYPFLVKQYRRWLCGDPTVPAPLEMPKAIVTDAEGRVVFERLKNGQLRLSKGQPVPAKAELSPATVLRDARRELTGHRLGCWCKDKPKENPHNMCHADVLVELVTQGYLTCEGLRVDLGGGAEAAVPSAIAVAAPPAARRAGGGGVEGATQRLQAFVDAGDYAAARTLLARMHESGANAAVSASLLRSTRLHSLVKRLARHAPEEGLQQAAKSVYRVFKHTRRAARK